MEKVRAFLDSRHRSERKKRESEEAVDGFIWGVRRNVTIDVVMEWLRLGEMLLTPSPVELRATTRCPVCRP